MVNSQVAVYNRATLGLASQIDLDTFVGRPTNFHCDPQVLWDQQASRWFYAALDCDGGSQNFLVVRVVQDRQPDPAAQLDATPATGAGSPRGPDP